MLVVCLLSLTLHHPNAWANNNPPTPAQTIERALQSGALTGSPAFEKHQVQAFLQAAGIPEASQVLVFSKTSLQNRLISPSSPRAIYFSDDLYLGWVPGGLLELAWANPQDGTALYTLAPSATADDPPALSVDPTCLNCHEGPKTRNEPGLMIRSVFTDANGLPLTAEGSYLTDHTSPLSERWGGWYVTGDHGVARHLGNQTTDRQQGRGGIDREAGANQQDLSAYFQTAAYPRATSDIVALMVLEHQVQMHNLYTQSALVIRKQIERSRQFYERIGEVFNLDEHLSLQQMLQSRARKIVDGMLFVDEAALPAPITGDPAFQEAFLANRRAVDGHALKDFDLQTRLFKHRFSYTVYSQAFRQLPEPLKQAVFQEIRERWQDNAQAEKTALIKLLSQTLEHEPHANRLWTEAD